MDAITNHGIPVKVRSDLGGENIEVWRYMIDQHRSDRAVVVGSSTHNEQIEHLWRDVQRCVDWVFYSILKQLEEEEKLDPQMKSIYIAYIEFSYHELIFFWVHLLGWFLV